MELLYLTTLIINLNSILILRFQIENAADYDIINATSFSAIEEINLQKSMMKIRNSNIKFFTLCNLKIKLSRNY